MEHCSEMLKEFEVKHDVRVISAHRTPKRLEKFISETSTNNEKNTKDLTDNNFTTVDEIFGETAPNMSDSIETKSDLAVDSPFQSLIEFVQGDMVVKTKNVYALKKLLSSYTESD
mgnify:CR=1 FL=1